MSFLYSVLTYVHEYLSKRESLCLCVYIILEVWQFLIAIPLCPSLLSAILSQIFFHSSDPRSYASLLPRVSTAALCLSSCCLTLFACVCTVLIVFVSIFQNGIA